MKSRNARITAFCHVGIFALLLLIPTLAEAQDPSPVLHLDFESSHEPSKLVNGARITQAQDGSGMDAPPLVRAHAHNDYEHPRPLLDALAHRFCSVEADVHLAGETLLVGHDPEDLAPERTLERLYLAPLRERVYKYGGSVFRQPVPFMLMIDIKTEAESTYKRLEPLLAEYADILTRYEVDRVFTNAVSVILSGNRPTETVARQTIRYAAIDGRLPDLNGSQPVELMPLISDNWTSVFSWKGTAPLPSEEYEQLTNLVEQAHQQNRQIRFWKVPDNPAAWKVLQDAGVDWINTDNLSGLEAFFDEKSQTKN